MLTKHINHRAEEHKSMTERLGAFLDKETELACDWVVQQLEKQQTKEDEECLRDMISQHRRISAHNVAACLESLLFTDWHLEEKDERDPPDASVSLTTNTPYGPLVDVYAEADYPYFILGLRQHDKENDELRVKAYLTPDAARRLSYVLLHFRSVDRTRTLANTSKTKED